MAEEVYPYTSLCIVTGKNSKNIGYLKRLADLENDEFKVYRSSDYKTLHNQNCNLSINFIGVFGWRKTSDRKGLRSKFNTESNCYFEKCPIEITIFEDCSNENDLKNILRNGVDINFSTGRALIVYRVDDNIFRGVFCSKHNFKNLGNKMKLKETSLPLYEVKSENFIRVENKVFYSRLNLDIIIGDLSTRNLDGVIKEKIIARAKWTTFKSRVSEKDLEIFLGYLKNFSTKDFYSEIAEEYRISVNEAVEYVNKFVSAHEEYLQTEVFNDEVFSNILVNCPRLLEVLQKMAYEQWQAENQEKISEANRQLTAIHQNISDEKLQLDKLHQEMDRELSRSLDLENEIERKKTELDELFDKIKQREGFAAEVEQKISQRLETARQNVADFICEMAFVNPNFGDVQTSKNIFYRAGETVDGDEFEIEDLEDFIYTLETELGVEGTQDENILPFAAYLTAAYMNKILLLLAGPNARDIADAFSVTLTEKTAAIFDCANVNSFADLKIVSDSDDEVIAVLNPFAPNFIAYLPELVNIKGKFIFAIYPFAEDLKIEPRSFYNYFLPVFTELIIDRPPARNFSTKWLLPDKLRQEMNQRYNPDKISISAEKRMQKLKKDMREFLQEKKSAQLFADFPLAYVKGQEEKFIANFKGEEKILEKIREFLGDDE